MGGDPSGSWLSYVEYAAGAIITEMNATVVVPADPQEYGRTSFWYGLQTAKGNGALIQPILAWGQNGVANGWSIFHEVYDWNTGRDYRSPETLKVYAGDVLTQSVRYRPENNSYDMFISSDGASGGGGGGGGGGIEWNYQLQASQGGHPEHSVSRGGASAAEELRAVPGERQRHLRRRLLGRRLRASRGAGLGGGAGEARVRLRGDGPQQRHGGHVVEHLRRCCCPRGRVVSKCEM